MKLNTRNPQIISFSNYEFRENQRRKSRTLSRVSMKLYSRVYMTPYHIFEVKNALAKSVCYATKYIICSLIYLVTLRH